MTWKTSEWEEFCCLMPRRIDGRWHWMTKAQRRTVYVGGALGLLCESWRTEYRCAR